MFKRVSATVKKFWAALALLSAELLVVVILFLVAMASFAYLIRRVFVLHESKLDQSAFAFFQKHVSPRNDDIMEFFTFLGTHWFLIPANLILIAYFLFVRKHRWYSIQIPAIAISSVALMAGLKHIFDRARPDDPLLFAAKGLSFPSGHAMMSVTFYGLLIYIVYKTISNGPLKWTLMILLLLLVIVISLSRIYLRVHYASDILAGWCVGFIWLVFAIWLLNKIERYSMRNIQPQ